MNRPSVLVLGAELIFFLLTIFGGLTVPVVAWFIWTLVGVGLLVTGH